MSLDNKTSGSGGIPPSGPPKNNGGLSWWQKAVIGAGIATVALVGYFGIIRPQQYKPVSTPAPHSRALLNYLSLSASIR